MPTTRGPGQLEASGSLTSAGAVGRWGETPTGWKERTAFVGASNAAAAHLFTRGGRMGSTNATFKATDAKKAFINHQNFKNTRKTDFFSTCYRGSSFG